MPNALPTASHHRPQRTEQPTGPNLPLSEAALEEARNTLAPNTRRAYRDGLRRIENAIRHDLALAEDEPVPMNDTTISTALRYLEEAGMSASTITVTVAAVRFAAKIASIPNPVGPSSELVMKAIHRRAPEQAQAAAIVWESADAAALLAAKTTHDDGTPTLAGLRDAAIISVMSDTLMRVSEASALRTTDIERLPDGDATLRIRSHKTSAGEMSGGSTEYLGKPTVARIDAWLNAAGIDPANDRGFLFRRLHKGDVAARCALCDSGHKGCCRHDVAPHTCCVHPPNSRRCTPGQCCLHSSDPHTCCIHTAGDPQCDGAPCCRHLGGCDECRCRASIGPESLRRIIKTRAANADIAGAVSGHSLRVGSAVSLARANAELPAIMQAGRWSSAQTVARYTRREQASKGAVARLRYDAA